MMSPAQLEAARARLLSLLPLFYRTLDARSAADGERGPLVQLIDVLAEQGALVEEDIARAYDDWFIETCDDWAVPYIGALLGTPMLPGGLASGQRRFVANTLGYRRRKGTARVLEQLAGDVTGWSARAVEAFRGFALTQSLLHVRPGQGGTADLRDATRSGAAGSAFDRFAHSIDVRRPGDMAARWSIPNVDLFAWRLEAHRLPAAEAMPDAGVPWLFHADPNGLARPWLNRARPDSSPDQIAREADLPVPLRRRPLADDLRQRRFAAVSGDPKPEDWFTDADGGEDSVFRLSMQMAAGDDWETISPTALRVANLGDISIRPPAAIPARDGGGAAAALVDPTRGRIAIPQGAPIPHALRVDHSLGFAAPIGAGPFDRNRSLARLFDDLLPHGRIFDWQAGVAAGRLADPAEGLFATLDSALQDWASGAGQPRIGLLLIEDSAVHRLPGGADIALAPGETLIIAAARWPGVDQPRAARIGAYDAVERRPHLVGDLRVSGGAGARLILDGLSHAGALDVAVGDLAGLTLSNCSLAVDQPLTVAANPELAVSILRSLTGPILLDALVPRLILAASLVDAGAAAAAIAAPGALLEADSCTVLGAVAPLRELHASDTLFRGLVTVDRIQMGCLRFSYAPPGSRTPRRYRCQPETAIDAGADPKRVVPQFVSRDRASPWYGQLHPLGHDALRRGGSDGGEIGAFRFPSSSLLEANIRVATGDYLRVGLTAGLVLAT